MKAAQRRLAEIESAPLPPAAIEHLWLWWHELHAGRRSNGWTPERLSWPDIEAWARLTGARPRPAEVRVLMQIDVEWLVADAKRREAQRPKG